MQLEQFTYRSLSSVKSRNEMLCHGISSLGTQSGGFGMFEEKARVLTVAGAARIKQELKDNACLDLAELYDTCPSLKLLIK